MNAVLPERLAAFVERDRVAVEVLTTGEAAHTAEDAARILGLPVAAIVKTMVLTDGRRAVAAIVPGDRRLDRRKVAAAAGMPALRFATADQVLEFTGYPPGGVAPFAFSGAVTVVIDASLASDVDREVVAGGGRPELLLRVAVGDLIRHAGAVVAPIMRDDDPHAAPRLTPA